MTDKYCLICGGAYIEDRRPGLLSCTACGFISANVDLTGEQLEALYSEKYFFGEEYFDYELEKESLEINFRARIRTLRRYMNVAQGALFEIGCAYGYFLNIARSSFRAASGIDISKDAVTHATKNLGLNAVAADYLSYQVKQHPDAIVMWDVIEHLPRPDLFVEKASADLSTGGLIAITTGDISSLNARLRGKNWRMIHPPTHLHYFSIKTLTLLLEKNGFEVLYARHPGTSRNLRSILYIVLAMRLKMGKLYDRIGGWSFFDRSISLNLGDIMFVIAKKREVL
jgi:hypothetical protein